MKSKGIFNKDLNHTGIKYSPGAVDVSAYPRYMPWLFWGSVCVVFGLIAWAVS